MPWGVAAAVVGGVVSAKGAKDAAKTQSQAADKASEVQQAQYDQTRADSRPFYETGIDATNAMRQRMGLAPVQSSYQREAVDQAQSDSNTATYASLRAQLAPQFTTQGQVQTPYGGGVGAGSFMDETPGASSTVDEAALNAEISRRLAAAGQGGQSGIVSKDGVRGEGARFNQQLPGGTGQAQGTGANNTTQFGFQAPTDRVTQAQAAINTATRQNSAQARPESPDVLMQMDPGYQFRLQQGQQALDRTAAARGGLLSGRAAKDMGQYSQGLASQEYGAAFDRVMGLDAREWGQNSELDQRDYSRDLTNANRAWDQNASLDNRDYSRAWDLDQSGWNRLASMAGMGQTSQQNTSSLGANMANNVAGNTMAAGESTASGQVGASNAMSAGLTGGYNTYQTNKLYDAWMKKQG